MFNILIYLDDMFNEISKGNLAEIKQTLNTPELMHCNNLLYGAVELIERIQGKE